MQHLVYRATGTINGRPHSLEGVGYADLSTGGMYLDLDVSPGWPAGDDPRLNVCSDPLRLLTAHAGGPFDPADLDLLDVEPERRTTVHDGFGREVANVRATGTVRRSDRDGRLVCEQWVDGTVRLPAPLLDAPIMCQGWLLPAGHRCLTTLVTAPVRTTAGQVLTLRSIAWYRTDPAILLDGPVAYTYTDTTEHRGERGIRRRSTTRLHQPAVTVPA